MCRWCQVPPRAAGLAASDSVGTWDLNKNEWPKYFEVKLKYTIWDGIELQALCFSFHFMFFTCFSPTWPTQHQYDLHSLHLHHRGGGLRTCRSCRPLSPFSANLSKGRPEEFDLVLDTQTVSTGSARSSAALELRAREICMAQLVLRHWA